MTSVLSGKLASHPASLQARPGLHLGCVSLGSPKTAVLGAVGRAPLLDGPGGGSGDRVCVCESYEGTGTPCTARWSAEPHGRPSRG